MEQTLLKLFWGEILPSEYSTTNVPQHWEKRRALSSKHDAFWEKLNAIDSKLGEEMNQILEQQLEVDQLEVPEAFCDGFRLGAKIMIDVLTERK